MVSKVKWRSWLDGYYYCYRYIVIYHCTSVWCVDRSCSYLCVIVFIDSPGIPPSANTHQLFRGFSFVATSQIPETTVAMVAPSRQDVSNPINPISEVCKAHVINERWRNENVLHSCARVFSRQHLRGDVAFSDVYELKEEVGQTTTSVCKRCLHRVTAVEYSVKVANSRHSQHSGFKYNSTIAYSLEYTINSRQPSRLDFKHKPTRAVLYSLFILRFATVFLLP